MAKGLAVKFSSYEKTVPALLKVIKLEEELKHHNKIVLKPFLRDDSTDFTSPLFLEAVLKFCMEHKNPGASILIAEGSEKDNTIDLFEEKGYKSIAEKYAVGLVDLNQTETQKIQDGEFLKFDSIMYPSVLQNSFIISLPKLADDEEFEMLGSLSNMMGAFPAQHYSGLFSRNKSKIKNYPVKFVIHDILKCKMPDLAIVDASSLGLLLAGKPFETDRHAAKLLNRDWKLIPHLRLVAESFHLEENKR